MGISGQSNEGVKLWDEELSTAVKHKIEKYWRSVLKHQPFDESSEKQKYYVLSMFPYPSGALHMGHVRVYSIADAIARFHRMRGQNVFQPMAWDAFGLPAENAALDRSLDPDRWTQSNIANMKHQMEEINFSFDWDREFASCDSDYYRWTQFLFLKLYENGLAYQKEALVNWDPIDKTVLADEQVGDDGRSWRSGAKVEKKKLKQWFIRTTRFAKDLYDGLNDPDLKDWRDIIKMQKHWIGDCCGVNFDFEIVSDGNTSTDHSITIWTKTPEFVDQATFVAVRRSSMWGESSGLKVKNPFTTDLLPVIVTDDVPYPEGADTYLGIPSISEEDRVFAETMKLPKSKTLKSILTEDEKIPYRREICAEARRRGIGGWPTSSKLRDWLISRQRYWGAPIPMVHCQTCGVTPVAEEDLPVKLPPVQKIVRGKNPLLEVKDWLNTKCPKCGGAALRETDTMDTFVDSSWYYLRFLDPDNVDIPFSREKAMKFMPVDVYVGGKEHAVLHLYYSRFFSHFLYSAGLLPQPEPFLRLLVQGLVKGKTFKNQKTGEYVKADMVEMDGKSAKHKETKEPLLVSFDKMSKSKFNGVDPMEMFQELSCDSTRLIMLADVAPTSNRNWSSDTFPGILGWQHRLWLTVQNFLKYRKENLTLIEKSDKFLKEEEYLWDSRNFYVKGVTFNFIESYQLSVGISKMIGLTNSIRKSLDKEVIALCGEYEKALAAQIIMLAPVAPHFAAELWAGFASAPNQINQDIIWDKPVILQPWPKVDSNYSLTMTVFVNREEISEIKIPKLQFDVMTHGDAWKKALQQPEIVTAVGKSKITRSYLTVSKDCSAKLFISTERVAAKSLNGSDLTEDASEEEVVVVKRKKKKPAKQVLG